MRPRQPFTAAAGVLLACAAASGPAGAGEAAAAACELVMTEHRSARPLVRTAMPSRALHLSFVHSVLGTPVEDRYVWRAGAWHLVEERFEGQGYGLPHAAGPGERLEHDGAVSRLLLDRRVEPLLVRPLPAQRMRVRLDDGRQWLLGELAAGAVEIRAAGC